MRFYLSFLLVFICVFATAQVPPMAIGGSQGIDVSRVLIRNWMSVPLYVDTPSSPLTGSGWPGRGYLILVTKPDTCIAGNACPPKDTSLWEYTGQRWKRVGMDYLTKLIFGGNVTQNNSFARQHIVSSYGAFINGGYYRQPSAVAVTADPKAADSTSRIDVIVITKTGPVIRKGQARVIPFKPKVAGDEIELSTIYFRSFDTVPRFIPSTATGVTNLFRVPGKDSIYFSIDTSTLAIKDSVGISTATNGLSYLGKNVKLGGSLIENTNINLSSQSLNVLSGADTARFVDNGGLNLIVKGASNSQAVINQYYISSANTSTGRSAYLESSGSLGLNNGTYDSYLDNLGVTNPLVTLRFPNKPSGDYIIATTSDLSAANGLTKDSTVFRLGGSLNQNTNIDLSTRRLSILSGSDTSRFFANGSFSLGATPSDSTYRFNVNGGAKMDSLVVDSLYAKFGRYLGDGSTPFAPIEFRATSGNRARIDLRPASNGGWNSNWYGAITHNGTETDILSANYGSLYLGASFWTASSGIYLGNTRNNPSMYIRNNNNVLIGDTANTGFRLDVNGIARVRDTLTLSTTPVTADTSANDLLVINSSNGQVRRFTGAFPGWIPTLEQVTTAGNTTTDSLNIKTPLGKTAVSITSFDFAGAENTSGQIIFRNTFDSSRLKINELGFDKYFTPTSLSKEIRFNNIRDQYSQISFPDSSGTLAQRVKANGVTYSADFNGVVDIGDYWLSGSATLDFGNTAAQNSADLTITVTGAANGDVVSLGVPNSSVNANTCFTAWVSATDTVTVRFNNYSSGAVDPASGTFKIKVLK